MKKLISAKFLNVALVTVLSLVMLIVDLSLPLGIAGGVPYIAVVFLSIWLFDIRYVFLVSAVSCIFVLLGYLYSPIGGILWMVVVNRLLAVTVICITAIMGMKWIKSQKRLHDAKVSAEDATNAKSEFLATISHEVRTPINAIVGLSDILKGTELNKEQKHYVDNIVISSNVLLSLISDILDLSKIESGKIELASESFNINDLIEDTCMMFGSMVEEKGLTLKYELCPKVPPLLVGDSLRLRQVLWNLTANAIKYTEEGEVFIDCSFKEDMPNEVLLRISVTDTGIGISDDKINSIFEFFSQVDASSTRTRGGSGVGLALASVFLDLMGSHLYVDSKLGVGSKFYFDIAFKLPDSDRSEKDVEVKEEQVSFEGLNVLVADDDEINRLVIKSLLKNIGCNVSMAENGLEAVAEFKEGDFDLVFMDISMPEMDGYEATEQIRNYESETNKTRTNIIALTAMALIEDKNRCLASGMDDFLTKPINSKKLIEKMSAKAFHEK